MRGPAAPPHQGIYRVPPPPGCWYSSYSNVFEFSAAILEKGILFIRMAFKSSTNESLLNNWFML